MLTRRGWALAAGSVALAVAGRLLGILELFVLAAGAAGLLAAGLVAVTARRPHLEATRTVRPSHVHVGGDTRVELTVNNRGERPSPVLTIGDSFARVARAGTSGVRRARLLLAPLPPGRADSATYRLPADHRGVYVLGPLEAVASDPFGLWSRVTVVAPQAELTVYPAIETLAPPAHHGGDDSTAGAPTPATMGPTGDDLYGLRPYRTGDDLRLVHWASTARTGELVVRQLEQPRQGRMTVLLDVRTAAHTEGSFEAAVSAAASIVSASWASGALVRLVTTAGTDSRLGAGHNHLEAVMEHLATVEAEGEDRFRPAVAGLHRVGNGGDLAVVTTAAAVAADLDLVAGLRSRFGALTVVAVDAGDRRRPAPADVAALRRSDGVTVLTVPVGARLSGTWDVAVGAHRRAGRP